MLLIIHFITHILPHLTAEHFHFHSSRTTGAQSVISTMDDHTNEPTEKRNAHVAYTHLRKKAVQVSPPSSPLPPPSAADPSRNGRRHFWDLPPELRDLIYEYAYTGEKVLVYHGVFDNEDDSWIESRPAPLDRLVVSRQYYWEAVGPAYRFATFSFKDPEDILYFIQRSDPQRTKTIQRVEIDMLFARWTSLADLGSCFPCLEDLRLTQCSSYLVASIRERFDYDRYHYAQINLLNESMLYALTKVSKLRQLEIQLTRCEICIRAGNNCGCYTWGKQMAEALVGNSSFASG